MKDESFEEYCNRVTELLASIETDRKFFIQSIVFADFETLPIITSEWHVSPIFRKTPTSIQIAFYHTFLCNLKNYIEQLLSEQKESEARAKRN